MKEKQIRVTHLQVMELQKGNTRHFVGMLVKLGMSLEGKFKELLGPEYDDETDEHVYTLRYEEK